MFGILLVPAVILILTAIFAAIDVVILKIGNNIFERERYRLGSIGYNDSRAEIRLIHSANAMSTQKS